MYAVVRALGKQHRVTKGERLKVPHMEGEVGTEVTLGEVLLIGGEGEPKIGRPIVAGAAVSAKIVTQDKEKKELTMKRRRRKGYHRIKGYREAFTEVEILGITG